MEIKILDTTLRDGEQAPGVSFSTKEKLKLAEKLFTASVDEIEAGICIDKFQKNIIKEIINRYPEKKISAWSRLNLDDLKNTKDTGVRRVHISIPASNYLINSQLGSLDYLKAKLDRCIDYSKKNFEFISIGLQDVFRANEETVVKILELLELKNINRVKLSDTVGYALPYEVEDLVNLTQHIFTGEVAFHGHNDIGLALANSLKAIESGANTVDVTVNGLGERAGNTSLEEFSMVIDKHKNFTTNIKLDKLKKLSDIVAIYSNRDVSYKPVVGNNVYVHESGIHCKELLKNPLSYQPYNPNEIGLGQSRLVIGAHSGRSIIEESIKSMGFICNETKINKIISKCKAKAREKKNYLNRNELHEIYAHELGEL